VSAMTDHPTSNAPGCRTCGRHVPLRRTERPGGAWPSEPPEAICPTCLATHTTFGRMFKALAEHSGASYRTIQAGLRRQGAHVGLGTLSSYASGDSEPPRTAAGQDRVRDLERYFGVPCGVLLRLWRTEGSGHPPLGGARPAPGARSAADAAPAAGNGRSVLPGPELHPRKQLMEQRIGRFGGGMSRNGIAVVGAAEYYTVDAAGFPCSSDITLTICAIRPGISTYWYLHTHERNEHRPHILPVEGCRVGTMLTEESYRTGRPDEHEVIDAAELLLGCALVPYRPHRLRYRVVRSYLPDAEPPRHSQFRRGTGANCDSLTVGIEFRGPQPRRLDYCVWPDRRYEMPRIERPVTGRRDEVTISRPAPGCYGWTWDLDQSSGSGTGCGRRHRAGAVATA
jgi:hypothetical protein